MGPYCNRLNTHAVKRLLMCGYNFIGNSNGLASFEDLAVIFIEWLAGRAKIVVFG